MTTKIAILRGINVGGKRKILMKDLRELFTNLGYSNLKTYIQSGNVIFQTDKNEADIMIANKIEKAITDKYGFSVPVIIINPHTLAQLAANNPFITDGETPINHLHLTFLKEAPSPENHTKILTYNYAPDQFVIKENAVYIFCQGKYHKSKLTNNFFEKKLKVTATTRNWKTVLRLLELSR